MEKKILEALKNVLQYMPLDDESAIDLIKDDATNLIEKFSLDSFLRVQFIIELEEVFGIEIDMEKIDLEMCGNSGKLKEMLKVYLLGENKR